MKNSTQRLNNVIGQIEGIKKMMEQGDDCIKILTQLKAARSAVSSVMNIVIDNQFENCMTTLNSSDKKLLGKIKDYVKTN